jgi:hypothetical protein
VDLGIEQLLVDVCSHLLLLILIVSSC